jgi:hypothetical protein
MAAGSGRGSDHKISYGRQDRPRFKIACSRLCGAMFCPQCKAEYRQGFTHCVDCDVDLIYSLLPESPFASNSGEGDGAGREDKLRLVWKGNSQTDCLGVCRDLMKAEIPYKVAQIPAARDFRMRVKCLYEIGVPDGDYERAKELLGIEGEFADSCYDEEDEREAPPADSEESLPRDDSPPDAEVRNDSYLKPWYPEDATVEIWSQNGDDISGSVVMALKENLIHHRLDRHDGVSKVFVLPEDEPRAREIVREITEGEPPK